MNKKYICVYCGSSMGNDPGFKYLARETGRVIAQAGYGLVYGGAGVGLMGEVAGAVLDAGGSVTGVIPKIFSSRLSHPGLTQIHVVETMHERKKMMFDLSDGFIALPGGFGTLEEMAEMITWAQIGINKKPCGLLNYKNFYDPLISLTQNMVSFGYTQPAHKDMILIETEPLKLLKRFQNYHAPAVDKWVS